MFGVGVYDIAVDLTGGAGQDAFSGRDMQKRAG